MMIMTTTMMMVMIMMVVFYSALCQMSTRPIHFILKNSRYQSTQY